VKQSENATITDKNNQTGIIEGSWPPPTETSGVWVKFGGERWALVPLALLSPCEEGGYCLAASFADFEQNPEDSPAAKQAQEPLVIPIKKERARARKRTMETGRVRVRKVVSEHEEEVDVPLVQDEIEIERVPIHRQVDQPPPIRSEGETLIIPVVKEILVIQKQLMIEEEWHIRKKTKTRHETKSVVLREEDLIVERIDSPEGEEAPT